ncbi:hypothetical protein A1O3_00940 [Capronia epimyces CBS 606.96]|uniref:Uncharacterized protein n=1 Tax=Capronia epimyces CBS 606.96 TaxID=1182542 RepID=W9YRX9_9EURO|nr:uncharacterized protein A1O3_00940 [Capronia epimyces CBS 606.96]EXJ92390.1 hypothetical protein A1O3_00940 [Capronia epimyces CBS 606.96]
MLGYQRHTLSTIVAPGGTHEVTAIAVIPICQDVLIRSIMCRCLHYGVVVAASRGHMVDEINTVNDGFTLRARRRLDAGEQGLQGSYAALERRDILVRDGSSFPVFGTELAFDASDGAATARRRSSAFDLTRKR